MNVTGSKLRAWGRCIIGKKKTTTTSSVKPIYGSQLEGAARDLNSAYQGQKGAIGQVSGDMVDLSGDLLSRFRAGDPTIGAARGFLEGELSADAANNPYLDEMTGIARDRVRNDIQAKMGTRGQTGGSDYYGNVGRGMYEVDTGLRYNDYNNTKARQMQAAGMAPGVVAGEYIPLAAGMQAGAQGAMLPIQAAAANAAGTGGLLGQYTNQKQTTKSGSGFMDMLGLGLQAASVFSDERLKENERKVGETDEGLPIFTYNYKGDPTTQMGVMAQHVAKKQKKALGPTVGGYKTVNYGEVR